MKLSWAASLIGLLLLMASFSTDFAAPHGTNTSPCCSRNTIKPIPQNKVKDYFYTGGHCALPSVVFLLKSGKQACVDPRAKWIPKLIETLEKE
ncbi:C-C motif chemokine 5-like [Sceloporus undulatus]|uniref:C-C motif chemokine 5-like n=1 Tax=Sceloporus undulatus TaxID=8520 RepID=UPI001C4A786F|nr:C-C motif chemokine 5-like [Sceloporus undulatus]